MGMYEYHAFILITNIIKRESNMIYDIFLFKIDVKPFKIKMIFFGLNFIFLGDMI